MEKELIKVLKAVANKRRIAILKFLKKAQVARVASIAEAIGLSFKATSKHLQILSGADILEKEQVSLSVNYSLAAKQHPIITKLISIL